MRSVKRIVFASSIAPKAPTWSASWTEIEVRQGWSGASFGQRTLVSISSGTILIATSSKRSFFNVMNSVFVNYMQMVSYQWRCFSLDGRRTCLVADWRNSRRTFLTFSPTYKTGSSFAMLVSSQWRSYMSPRDIYEESVWNNRTVGLQETDAGRWNERLRLRLSFLRLKVLMNGTRQSSSSR